MSLSPVKKGSFKHEDDFKITKNYSYLMDNFEPTDGTMDHMVSSLVFNTDDVDRVKNGGEKTRRGRVERFLNILLRSGPEAYEHFLEALKNSGNDALVMQLESTDTSQLRADDARLADLTEEQKTRQPTDAEASCLSAAFGTGWEHVFLELDISQAKIDQVKMAYPYSISTAIAKLIICWRQKNACNASFSVLLQALERANDHCTIDWNIVEKVVKEQQ